MTRIIYGDYQRMCANDCALIYVRLVARPPPSRQQHQDAAPVEHSQPAAVGFVAIEGSGTAASRQLLRALSHHWISMAETDSDHAPRAVVREAGSVVVRGAGSLVVREAGSVVVRGAGSVVVREAGSVCAGGRPCQARAGGGGGGGDTLARRSGPRA